jgi:MinD-like ATPase involved in chromosome partitioning or flagellar assembly
MANMTDKDLLGFARELGAVAAREDVMLLDLGAGIAPATILSMLAAEWIVLVTQPEIAALVDAYCDRQVTPSPCSAPSGIRRGCR